MDKLPKLLSTFCICLLLFLTNSIPASAGIFDGFNPGSTGIFGNLGDRVRSIFQGRDVELGGSVIPYTPSAPAPPGPSTPSSPGAGQFLKAWVEWDTFYRGTQPDAIVDEDPLGPIHREYIVENGCCESCGEVVIETACDYCQRNQFGIPHRGELACSQCGNISSTYHATIEHSLRGWCGGTADLDTEDFTRASSGVTQPPADSPGPNDALLPGSIPNKMIRRDGYVYKCLKIACTDEELPTPPPPWVPPGVPPTPVVVPVPEERWNYIEFQTEIFHSNDFLLDLHIQNYGSMIFERDSIRVFRHAEDGREWPHNIDISDGFLGFFTQPKSSKYPQGMPARLNKHGNTMLAHKEPVGNNLRPDDPTTPKIDGEHRDYFQYDPDTVRDMIPSVPIQFGWVGGNVPRDFNFVCDKEDGSEGDRCPADMENYSGDDAYLLLERPLTVDEFRKYFFEYRDVSAPDMGGCGYNASSNNSVIGPITYQFEYGGTVEGTRHGRTVLNVSIPIGNPVDTEGIPFGWPTTGRIQENWGNTSFAQELGRQRWLEDQRSLYDEYLYCPGEGQTYPLDGRVRAGDFLHPAVDIERAFNQIKPPNVYTTHAGWITYIGSDPEYPDKGVTVQVESDINRDHIPDVITRYSHLMESSLTFDIRHQHLHVDETTGEVTPPFNERLEFGSEYSMYVPRNYLLGVMGDSGSPGDTHLQYEIVSANEDGAPPGANGVIGRERCTDNIYQASCFANLPGQELREGNFFGRFRYYPELVLGNLFTNP